MPHRDRGDGIHAFTANLTAHCLLLTASLGGLSKIQSGWMWANCCRTQTRAYCQTLPHTQATNFESHNPRRVDPWAGSDWHHHCHCHRHILYAMSRASSFLIVRGRLQLFAQLPHAHLALACRCFQLLVHLRRAQAHLECHYDHTRLRRL
jgi:hypothetical protein